MNVSKEIILFCQAPADITYLLSVYEKEHKNNKISIFVINVENSFKFLSELNLKVENLVFIPYKLASLKQLSAILKERKRIKDLKRKYFGNLSGQRIYFFSRFEDWLTASFIKDLSKNNEVIYLDYYDFSAEIFEKKKLSIQNFIIRNIYHFITGVRFKFEIIEKLPEFPYLNYAVKRIEAVPDLDIPKKYAYHLPQVSTLNKPALLYFISPCEDVIYDCGYHDATQREIMQLMKDMGWCIIIKGHPRLGVPENIQDLADLVIPSYIPAEFINVSDISLCFGIITSAITYFALNSLIPTYSLVKQFKFLRADMANQYEEYLKQFSAGSICFVDNAEHLNKILQQKYIS